VNELVELLAARAPKLRQAVRDAKRAGHAYVILDGTLIPIDRVARDRPFYSGKHKKHGMNLQVIASPDGDLLWVSGALPGSVHDKKAEWTWGVLDELEKQGLVTLAIRATRAAVTRRSRTAGRTSPSRRKRPTAPTRSSAARRESERPAQDMGHTRQAPLLPFTRRETRQGNPRIAASRGLTRLETAPGEGRPRDGVNVTVFTAGDNAFLLDIAVPGEVHGLRLDSKESLHDVARLHGQRLSS
jgi:hypothetical protein